MEFCIQCVVNMSYFPLHLLSSFLVGECYVLDDSDWGGFSLYKDMIILLKWICFKVKHTIKYFYRWKAINGFLNSTNCSYIWLLHRVSANFSIKNIGRGIWQLLDMHHYKWNAFLAFKIPKVYNWSQSVPL